MKRPFAQVDVFASTPYGGNPVAVVLDGERLDTDQMQRFANWTNLSETTFVTPPTDPGADYALRIFTPSAELPFAGHPTLGTAHAWLESGGAPAGDRTIVQECAAGLVTLRRDSERLAFAAPPLVRSGPADQATIDRIAAMLGVELSRMTAVEWVDNGPGWVAVLFETADEVLALSPGFDELFVGAVAPTPTGSPEAFEVRAFFPKGRELVEDPVTGSLNASLAMWLVASGRADAPYVARQGTALGRSGRVHVSADEASHAADGTQGLLWIGGDTVTRISGTVEL